MEESKIRRTLDKLKGRAEARLKDPEKLKKLWEDATEKAKAKEDDAGPWAEVRDYLAALIRLVRAYARGEYRETPWVSMVLIVAAIIYFVDPFDLIPDVIPFAGYLDDATILAFVVRQVKADLDRFREWEARQQQAEPVA